VVEIVNPLDGTIVVLRIPVESFEVEVPVSTQVLVVEPELRNELAFDIGGRGVGPLHASARDNQRPNQSDLMSRPSSTWEWYSQSAVLPSAEVGPAFSGTVHAYV
jgi:hypothetical protein